MTREFRDVPSPAGLDELATILRRGGIAVLPTDTIYGLHAQAGDTEAVKTIVAMKERESSKPFIVLGSSIDQLEQAGAFFSARVRAIVAQLWPGPLTAIVPLEMPLAAARGAKTIGVRVPDLAWLRQLLDKTGPLVSTSANVSGNTPIERPSDLPAGLYSSLAALVDTGPLTGKASVLVDFTGTEPRVLREGGHLFTQKVWKTLRKSL